MIPVSNMADVLQEHWVADIAAITTVVVYFLSNYLKKKKIQIQIQISESAIEV